MANTKQIRRRIKSVQSTMQITKAMELVASSKVRRAKERVEQVRPYFDTIYQTMHRIAKESRRSASVYTKVRPVQNSLILVIAGDRGLAGGYNANIFKLASEQMADKQVKVLTIGRKAQEHYAKRDVTVLADYPGIAETMRIADTHSIVQQAIPLFEKGEVDEVLLCYTHYVSPMLQEAKCVPLLPLAIEQMQEEESKGAKVIPEYDPSPEAVFRLIVPEYLNGVLYGAVLESYASEQSARRMAMEAASDNASEMIDKLNLSYNRARQASITQEITEIVAGSGAVGNG